MYVRRLPSGKWQATVWLPVRDARGRKKRCSRTHPMKKVVVDWARAEESAIAAGTFAPHRHTGETMTLREYRQQWMPSRVVEPSTAAKATSMWRNHVEPVFGGHPLVAITRPQVRAWIARMRAAGVGPWTIQASVSSLAAILSAAVDDELIQSNPAHGMRLPRVDPKPPFFWTKDEAARIVAALRARDDRVATMVDLDMHVGLRWGELAGLKARFVDVDATPDTGVIHVVGVQTRHGWRPWPKSKLSRRSVPIPPHLREPMRALVAGLAPDDLVFPAPGGGAWHDTNFRRRVFRRALAEAGVRTGTPHDMRHTAASWLVQSGVPIFKVQGLLGHESITTTQRYSHLAPNEYTAITDAWR